MATVTEPVARKGANWQRDRVADDAVSVEHALPPYYREVIGWISDPSVSIFHFPAVVRRDTGADTDIWWSGVPGKWVNLTQQGWTVTHWKPLEVTTSAALATVRAEGRAEGMRQAANLAKWFGGEANMLQNDNVDRELNVARRDAAYKIQKRILAAIPQEQIEALTEAERELVDELSAPEHNPPSWDRWVNFDPDFRQKDIARLVRRGWVEKRGAPPHREYRLTESGRALHSKEQL